jgi:hypothetical protein
VHREYRDRGIAEWDDHQLVAAAGRVLAVPRAAPADSFVLHAPLELIGRAALLPHVAPGAREQARARIVQLGAAYEAAGEPVADPASISVRPLATLAADLVAAIGAGDLDAVDRFATQLGVQAKPHDLGRLLGEALTPALGAAGHAPILLHHFPRVALASGVTVEVVRGPAREIARHPDWRITWHDATEAASDRPALLDALVQTPSLGLPGNDFIYPLMHQVEEAGVAASLLTHAVDSPIDVAWARRDIARVAAWSMLQEPSTYAPYGWTHCLTMAQAVMGLAGGAVAARTAVAVAGTFVAGFRAGLGAVTLDPEWRPPRPSTRTLADAIETGPSQAAAYVWHSSEDARAAITSELVTRAAVHHDAHLVKYTHACLDAAADEPAARRLYLAAAAYLSAWWARQSDDGFFGGWQRVPHQRASGASGATSVGG